MWHLKKKEDSEEETLLGFLAGNTTVLSKIYVCIALKERYEVVKEDLSDKISDTLIRSFTACS